MKKLTPTQNKILLEILSKLNEYKRFNGLEDYISFKADYYASGTWNPKGWESYKEICIDLYNKAMQGITTIVAKTETLKVLESRGFIKVLKWDKRCGDLVQVSNF